MGDLVTAAAGEAAQRAYLSGAADALKEARRRAHADDTVVLDGDDIVEIIDELSDEIAVGDWPIPRADGA